jgi:hypothetical protein
MKTTTLMLRDKQYNRCKIQNVERKECKVRGFGVFFRFGVFLVFVFSSTGV